LTSRSYSPIPTTSISDRISREQYRAVGWVHGELFTVIFEVREDEEGELCRLVTLWKATREEQRLYEESS